MIRFSLAGLGLSALLAVPVLAQTANTKATQVAVVYDATTGAIDEIVIPDNDAELDGQLKVTLTIPNGVQVRVPISQINAVGFAAALTAVAPAVPSLQAQAAAAAVTNGLATPGP